MLLLLFLLLLLLLCKSHSIDERCHLELARCGHLPLLLRLLLLRLVKLDLWGIELCIRLILSLGLRLWLLLRLMRWLLNRMLLLLKFANLRVGDAIGLSRVVDEISKLGRKGILALLLLRLCRG